MKPIVYHVGLTPPPTIEEDEFQTSYCSVLQVEYLAFHLPNEINDMLNKEPILLLMSKNSVVGLDCWLRKHGLDSQYFRSQEFWTVGERTKSCLMEVLGIEAFHPDQMTGKGVLKALNEKKKTKVILICGSRPQDEFINSLDSFGINYFHFPVYEINIKDNFGFVDNFKNSKSNFIVITSPSAVDGVLQNLELNDLSEIKANIISIGPTTTEFISQKKGHVFHESRLQNIQILYDDLKQLVVNVAH